jgi:hypothetical protein
MKLPLCFVEHPLVLKKLRDDQAYCEGKDGVENYGTVERHLNRLVLVGLIHHHFRNTFSF